MFYFLSLVTKTYLDFTNHSYQTILTCIFACKIKIQTYLNIFRY